MNVAALKHEMAMILPLIKDTACVIKAWCKIAIVVMIINGLLMIIHMENIKYIEPNFLAQYKVRAPYM
jgi:hypothetical protein